jgi:hypothetical protein
LAQADSRFLPSTGGAFLVFLAAGMVVIAAILSGAWTGSAQQVGLGLLAALIICDLARADVPWIHYYDYAEKYALNPVTEFLLDKPWEHRVIGKLEPRGPGSGITRASASFTSSGCKTISLTTTSKPWTSPKCRTCRIWTAFTSKPSSWPGPTSAPPTSGRPCACGN